MIREAIAKGETVEIAFANACRELGVETTEAEFEILELPQKKTFGLFGGAPARVRAYIEEPDPVPEKPEKEERDPAQEAAAYLKSVLGEMGLPEATVEIRPVEAGAELVLGGDDIGFIIGHRGETLDALQYLASLVANHADGSYFRITLDVGNYREKRKETLESLGKKMAARAVKTGRNSSLEPMNPYERRIIHTAVQTVAGAKSWSEGVDQGRHVVIGPEGGERPQPRRNDRRGGGRNGGGRGGYNDGRRRPRSDRPRVNPAPRAEGPKTDDPSTPIYGRIEKK
ncbi:MAG: RNA-binding cell elongation regulator Jag/EloR [Acutalibacter sp.]